MIVLYVKKSGLTQTWVQNQASCLGHHWQFDSPIESNWLASCDAWLSHMEDGWFRECTTYSQNWFKIDRKPGISWYMASGRCSLQPIQQHVVLPTLLARFSQDQRAEDGLRLAAHHHKRESGGRRCEDTDAIWQIQWNKQYISQWPSRSDHSKIFWNEREVIIGGVRHLVLDLPAGKIPDVLQVAPKNRQSVLWRERETAFGMVMRLW